LILFSRGGSFEFLRGLHHMGLFSGNGVMVEKLQAPIDNRKENQTAARLLGQQRNINTNPATIIPNILITSASR